MCCRRVVRFPCFICVLLGVLLLVAGSVVILIWAFVPNFSQIYPIGLQAGAVTCSFGVLLVICGLIGLYRWHLRTNGTAIKRNSSARSKRASHGNSDTHEVYFAATSSFSSTRRESRGGLKKAHSTAYISLGSSHTEKIKVLGLVHGFISTTDLRHSLRMKCASLKGSTTQSQSNGVLRDPLNHTEQRDFTSAASPVSDFTHVAITAQCYKRFTREKSLRLSLPRIFVRPPLIRPTQQSHSQVNLSKISVEGLQLDVDGVTPSTRNTLTEHDAIPIVTEAKHSASLRQSNREVNFSKPDADIKPRRRLTRVLTTPPIGRASLFNLASPDCLSNTVWMSTGGSNLNGSILNNKAAHDSGASLDRTNSGKRFLLMNQTGQVISCTTLFGEELEMESVNSNSVGGVGCRQLQPCPGWNFFPVFVERDRVLSDDDLGKPMISLPTTNQNQSVHLSDCGLSFANSDLELSNAQTDSFEGGIATRSQHHSRHSHVLDRVRHFFKRVQLLMPGSSRGRRANNCKHTVDADAVKEVEAPSGRGLLISSPVHPASVQQSLIVDQSAQTEIPTGLKADSNATVCITVNPMHFTTEAKNKEISEENSAVNVGGTEIQTINNNNASVFSLPAISPDLWTADRPVWIMGVPVTDERNKNNWLTAMDTCDVILLQEHQKANYGPFTVTGSSSSVYAFHVRPPSRLHPTRTTTMSMDSQTRSSRANRSHGRARSLGRILFSDKSSIHSEV